LDRERKRPQMNISLAVAEGILARALDVLNTGDRSLLAALDELPAAIYVTDAHGVITYYNPACLAFAGRVPALGQDRWCVTWKLFTEDGTFLPHDQCVQWRTPFSPKHPFGACRPSPSVPMAHE
jgi:PAS domain-containing protein